MTGDEIEMIKCIPCKTCKGLGLIKVESIVMDRPHYSKEHGKIVYGYYGKNDWTDTMCPDCCEDN